MYAECGTVGFVIHQNTALSSETVTFSPSRVWKREIFEDRPS